MFAEGSRADDIAQAADQLNQRWAGFCVLLADRLTWLAYQTKVPNNYKLGLNENNVFISLWDQGIISLASHQALLLNLPGLFKIFFNVFYENRSQFDLTGGFFSPLLFALQVLAFYSLYEQCEQAVDGSENWLKVQAPPASEPEPLKVQLDRCRVSEATTGPTQMLFSHQILQRESHTALQHHYRSLFLLPAFCFSCSFIFCYLFDFFSPSPMHLVTALFCKYFTVTHSLWLRKLFFSAL